MALTARLNAQGAEEIELLLEGLVLLNLSQLRRGLCPPLYQSGARYQREPRGQEHWQTALEVYRSKVADCEDLAAYLCASLRLVGESGARVKVIDVRPGLKHVVVRRADGTIEDPSKRLGMKGRG